MGYTVKPGEIAIILRPTLDEDNEWTGAISTGLIFGAEKNVDGQRAALDLAITMSAAQNFLEENPDWIDMWDVYRSDLLQEIFPEAWKEAEQQYEEDTSKEAYSGNVISLNAWTKTEGSA